MSFNNTLIKTCVFDAEIKQSSVKISKIIVNKIVSIINNIWMNTIKPVVNYHSNNNCRKQIKFNLDDWWIMHLHHIGLPPATNRSTKLQVSGNSLINTKSI